MSLGIATGHTKMRKETRLVGGNGLLFTTRSHRCIDPKNQYQKIVDNRVKKVKRHVEVGGEYLYQYRKQHVPIEVTSQRLPSTCTIFVHTSYTLYKISL